MQRNVLNFLVDFAGLVAMLGMLGTGLLLRLVLPPGSRGGHGLQLWGLSRHEWGDIHFWLAIALVALFVLHVALHWDWVCAVLRIQILRRKDPGTKPSALRRNLAGVAFLVVLAAGTAGFLWAAQAAVEQSGRGEGEGDGWRGGRGTAIELDGSAGEGASERDPGERRGGGGGRGQGRRGGGGGGGR